MSFTIQFLLQADQDVQDAVCWHETQHPGLSQRFLTELERALTRIQADPESYPQVYQQARQLRLNYFPYAVYYLVEAERIVVISVFHTSRNPIDWQTRMPDSD